jgi:hypothetical protein
MGKQMAAACFALSRCVPVERSGHSFLFLDIRSAFATLALLRPVDFLMICTAR